MNYKTLVKLSNIIGIISIILLVYWVFVFISITVFGLKIFRENITETFYLSVVGILALMLGSLFINVMFNLTRIAEKHNQDELSVPKQVNKKIGLLFGLSFPLIFGLLFAGDYITSRKKEEMLTASAKEIIESNKEKTDQLLHYSFDKNWIINTRNILDLYENTDKHFPYVSVIVSDSIDKTQVFLGFRDYYIENDTIRPMKRDFILKTTKVEREYLKKVFYNHSNEVRFSANDGRYELFYPYIKDGKRIVLYFSEYQPYGKIGS